MDKYENLLEKLNHHNFLNKEDMGLIKKVLKKNINKKVDPMTRDKYPNYDEYHSYHTTYSCPNCECLIHLDWLEPRNYCPKCGQKLTLPKDDEFIINSFKDEYAFLSNFYESKFIYNGKMFRNSEAAFQAQKCPEREDEFLTLNAFEAKKLGRQVTLREDWEDVKDLIMAEVLEAKFNYNPSLKQMLIDTKDVKLVEGNTWNDIYWGVCKGVGENKLGKILMMLREEFQNDL